MVRRHRCEWNTKKINGRPEPGKKKLAADFLTRRGVKILERNFRCRQGEIDLIGMDGQYSVFVEVKYRNSTQWYACRGGWP